MYSALMLGSFKASQVEATSFLGRKPTGNDGENSLIVLATVQHNLRSDELLQNFEQQNCLFERHVDNDTNSASVVDRIQHAAFYYTTKLKQRIEGLQAQAGTLKLISCRVYCQSQHLPRKTISSQKACHECA